MRTALLAIAVLAALASSVRADEPDKDTLDAIPTNIRITRLQRQVEALKTRAWIAKADADRLKEELLGGGLGAQATIVHVDDMGGGFRLVELAYAVDGTAVFSEARSDLYKTDRFDILTGPIAPGGHTLSVVAVYRGHGYGVFKYLDKYSFTVRSSHSFTAQEGKSTRIEAHAYEKGSTKRLQDQPAMRFVVTDDE